MKVRLCKEPNRNRYIVFFCPGCNNPHSIPTVAPAGWKWNQLHDLPTLQPSIFVNRDKTNAGAPACHSFITDGRIQFLPDCTHALAGQTVDLPEVDEKWA